jgi:hypothetical protein
MGFMAYIPLGNGRPINMKNLIFSAAIGLMLIFTPNFANTQGGSWCVPCGPIKDAFSARLIDRYPDSQMPGAGFLVYEYWLYTNAGNGCDDDLPIARIWRDCYYDEGPWA